jgi:hypothetical protein
MNASMYVLVSGLTPLGSALGEALSFLWEKFGPGVASACVIAAALE